MDEYQAFEGLPWDMSLVDPSLDDSAQSSRFFGLECMSFELCYPGVGIVGKRFQRK
jgi:hypothetical protein